MLLLPGEVSYGSKLHTDILRTRRYFENLLEVIFMLQPTLCHSRDDLFQTTYLVHVVLVLFFHL